jgi:hypothetical protein
VHLSAWVRGSLLVCSLVKFDCEMRPVDTSVLEGRGKGWLVPAYIGFTAAKISPIKAKFLVGMPRDPLER